jgi:hypothetical protein
MAEDGPLPMAEDGPLPMAEDGPLPMAEDGPLPIEIGDLDGWQEKARTHEPQR